MSEIIKVPNIGDFENVEIIEILVKNGDKINKGDPIITLESDKSSVEVPSTLTGKILDVKVKIGDKVSENDIILELETEEKISTQKDENNVKIIHPNKLNDENTNNNTIQQQILSKSTGASPNTLKFARELGIDINALQGSGRAGRVKKEDIKNYIKNVGTFKYTCHYTEENVRKKFKDEIDKDAFIILFTDGQSKEYDAKFTHRDKEPFQVQQVMMSMSDIHIGNPASSVDKVVGTWRWDRNKTTLPNDCYRYDHKHNAVL